MSCFQIPPGNFRGLVESMPHGVGTVLAAHGGPTAYQAGGQNVLAHQEKPQYPPLQSNEYLQGRYNLSRTYYCLSSTVTENTHQIFQRSEVIGCFKKRLSKVEVRINQSNVVKHNANQPRRTAGADTDAENEYHSVSRQDTAKALNFRVTIDNPTPLNSSASSPANTAKYNL